MMVETRPSVPEPDLEKLRGGDPLPPLRADDHSDANPAVETPVEARQGFLGWPVLTVLISGLMLAVVAWITLEMLVY